MIAFAGLAGVLAAVGLYLSLSDRSPKRLLGAGLLVQAAPVTIYLGSRGAPLAEAFAVPALILAIALFLSLVVISGRGFDLHADDD